MVRPPLPITPQGEIDKTEKKGGGIEAEKRGGGERREEGGRWRVNPSGSRQRSPRSQKPYISSEHSASRIANDKADKI